MKQILKYKIMKRSLLVGLFISVILISCKTKMEETKQNIHRKWMLVQFEDFQKEKLIEKNCYLDLTDLTNASAKMGCNTLGFVYKLEAKNIIVFNEGRTTHMYCEDHEIESRFLNTVQSINSYKIEGHKLYLITNMNKELVFVAEDWD